jgi:glycerol-3-phosphate acyltransferase PlsY
LILADFDFDDRGMTTILALIIGFFLGSIPTALWVGQRFRGMDIRQHGSGNLGATNAFRVLGGKLGGLVLAGDVLKGVAAVLLMERLAGPGTSEVARLLAGLAAICGHMYSPWVDFQGGKGVATTLGVFFALAPQPMAVILFVGLGLIALKGYVSLAAVVGAVMLPPLLLIYGHGTAVILIAAGISTLVLRKHRGNLVRLFAGTERRVWEHRDGSSAAA